MVRMLSLFRVQRDEPHKSSVRVPRPFDTILSFYHGKLKHYSVVSKQRVQVTVSDDSMPEIRNDNERICGHEHF